MTVPYLLMSSYLYYIRDESPPLADHEYDWLCEYARQNWDKIQHPHKHLIKRSWLAAGSLYKLRDADYPMMVKGGAFSWLYGAASPLSNHIPQIAEQLRRIASALARFTYGDGL